MALCECGCGQETTVYCGIPRRFISGHNGKIRPENENPICRRCKIPLVIGDTWSDNLKSHHDYICVECNREYNREYREKNHKHLNGLHRVWKHKHGQSPMDENKDCTMFLGVHIAEQVFSVMFPNATRMPIGNHGFDFVCGSGMNIDVKSSCLIKKNIWHFNIGHNKIADYFLCLAFDNRDDLTPMHIWLVPGDVVNEKAAVTIAPSTTKKWKQYELDIGKVLDVCDVLRG